jgi:hypothetical protein
LATSAIAAVLLVPSVMSVSWIGASGLMLVVSEVTPTLV